MSLLAPTRGELLDRLSILELKIGATIDHQRAHWQEEACAIRGVLGLTDTEVAASLDYEHLAWVNHQIWLANEKLAFLAVQIIAPPNGLALEMFELNRVRVRLIEAIDRAAGQFVQHAKVGY